MRCVVPDTGIWYWYLILILLSGHTAGIKQALFNTDERRLISCGDDKTLRFWDIASGQEIKKIDLTNPVGGIELSKDQDILTVAHGQTVSFFNSETFEKIKEVNLPTTVFTASLYVLIHHMFSRILKLRIRNFLFVIIHEKIIFSVENNSNMY